MESLTEFTLRAKSGPAEIASGPRWRGLLRRGWRRPHRQNQQGWRDQRVYVFLRRSSIPSAIASRARREYLFRGTRGRENRQDETRRKFRGVSDSAMAGRSASRPGPTEIYGLRFPKRHLIYRMTPGGDFIAYQRERSDGAVVHRGGARRISLLQRAERTNRPHQCQWRHRRVRSRSNSRRAIALFDAHKFCAIAGTEACAYRNRSGAATRAASASLSRQFAAREKLQQWASSTEK